jgi:hypothetical protein
MNAERIGVDLRRRLLLVCVAFYLVGAAALFVVNETKTDVVRWAMAKDLSAPDVLWLLRLVPVALCCAGAWGGFSAVWTAIARQQKYGDLSAGAARVRGYGAALVAVLLTGLLAYLYEPVFRP